MEGKLDACEMTWMRNDCPNCLNNFQEIIVILSSEIGTLLPLSNSNTDQSFSNLARLLDLFLKLFHKNQLRRLKAGVNKSALRGRSAYL